MLLRSVVVDGPVTEWAVLSHGDVLLAGPVVTDAAGPHGAQVHQGPPRHDTDGKGRGAGGADTARVGNHRLAVSALRSVGPGVLGAVLDEYIHGQLLVFFFSFFSQVIERFQSYKSFTASTESSVSTR